VQDHAAAIESARDAEERARACAENMEGRAAKVRRQQRDEALEGHREVAMLRAALEEERRGRAIAVRTLEGFQSLKANATTSSFIPFYGGKSVNKGSEVAEKALRAATALTEDVSSGAEGFPRVPEQALEVVAQLEEALRAVEDARREEAEIRSEEEQTAAALRAELRTMQVVF
jgi:hypothetical protein